MLILSRRAGEVLRIGEEITVTVLGIKGGQVRLGIDAPRGLHIRREEPQRERKGREPGPSEEDGKPPDGDSSSGA